MESDVKYNIQYLFMQILEVEDMKNNYILQI